MDVEMESGAVSETGEYGRIEQFSFPLYFLCFIFSGEIGSLIVTQAQSGTGYGYL